MLSAAPSVAADTGRKVSGLLQGRCRSVALLKRFGPDKSLVVMRLELAADCPKRIKGDERDRCGVHYPELADLRRDEIDAALKAVRELARTWGR